MTLISIIIPVYNIEDYIEDCLNSVLNQHIQNVEIIIVNDGSTDNSHVICERYSEKYSQIRLINKPNGGLSDARNTGILSAKGEYVLFLDGDDFLKENTLNDLESYILSQEKPDMVIYNYIRFFQNNNKYKPMKKNLNSKFISNNNGITILEYLLRNKKTIEWMVWQCVYKREMLIENNLYFKKGRLYEDVLWLPEVFKKAQTIKYFDREIYVYRLEREGQITSTITEKSLEDNIYIPVYWSEKLKESHTSPELYKLLMNNFTIRYYYAIWFSSFLNNLEREKILKLIKDNKKFLNYSNGARTELTRVLVKWIGFKNTSIFFKLAINAKRRIIN